MKRPLASRAGAIATSIALSATLLPVGAFAAFTDVSSKTSYSTAIEALQAKGVLQGYANGSFGPNLYINRAEFLKIILEGAGIEHEGIKGNCFPDVKDEWFASIVCKAKELGIVGGFPDGNFYPGKNVTFVEATKIMSLAYKQKVSESYIEWYEPYANALEASKAIPPTINALDKNITRGEMAEMMWRISEKKIDQPAIGLLNVKNPDAKVNFASDKVQVATSCADLKAFVQTGGRGGATLYYDEAQTDSAAGAPTPAVAPMAPQAGGETKNARSQSGGGSDADYSKTNVQVEGVDEADIVKTDGEYLYIVRGSKVSIVDVNPVSNMKEVATLDHQKQNFNPTELYVDGNRLIVVGNAWIPYNQPIPYLRNGGAADAKIAIWPPYWNTSRTEVRIYDITDRTNPKSDRTISFEGNSISTRKIEDKLYLVMNQSLPWWGGPMPLSTLKEENLLPKFKDSARSTTDTPVVRCSDVSILPRVPSPQYLIVAVVPTNDLKKDVQKEVILGNGENVYASLNNLYVANTQWNYEWDSARSTSNQQTNIFRFAFTDTGVDMQAQGSVPGNILNQFSMDEHKNSFRIATTTGEMWSTPPTSKSHLFVLNKDMKVVGQVNDLAPGERIYSTRFLGDRAYMVTYRNTDPLFVIDTSDPRNPKVLGQLKIPGYSDYLHPYDENHIIGFGKDAVEAKVGSNAWYQGMKLAVFDVTDVEKPKELHKEIIGDRGTQSPLLWNHKALLFEKENNLLAFPVTVAEIKNTALQYEGQDPASIYGETVFQGAYVYDLSLKDGFKLRGKISHYTEEDIKKMGQYFYGKEIERIVRVKDQLLTISQAEVDSHSLQNVSFQGRVSFPQENPQVYPMMDSGIMR